MDDYVIELINRAKEEVDPAEWYIIDNAYSYDTNEDAAAYIVPDGRIVEGSLLTHDVVLVVARLFDSKQRIESFNSPIAVVYSDKLDITFDVYHVD